MADWDLFVIGGGSGGVRAARTASAFGAKVALAEVLHLGGTCVNVGCIPKKLLVYAGRYGQAFHHAEAYGWTVNGAALDWGRLVAAKDAEVLRLNGVYGRLLDNSGVQLIEGRARVAGPNEVVVGGERHTAGRILMATGGRPRVPAVPGRELGCTSNEAFYLRKLPPRVVVVGGGYIGTEFAGIFRTCGAEVTVVAKHHHLLHYFDHDLGDHLTREYRRMGIDFRLHDRVAAVRRFRGALQVLLEGGDALEADEVLFATGRVPNTVDMGLEDAGVALSQRGGIVVDEGYRSNVPSISALGDVTDNMQLTPLAIEEAIVFARREFNGEDVTLDTDHVPTVVFSTPSVGTVGLSEHEAVQRGHDVAVYRSTFTPLEHTLTGSGEKTLMKLVVDRATDRVLGVHLVSPDAGEILQGFAVALTCGATKAQLDATVGIHPTAAEELVTMRSPIQEPGALAENGSAPSGTVFER